MSFHKKGENYALVPSTIQAVESVIGMDEVNARFEKFARNLKKIAPKANDFLYFSTAMMSAAEKNLYNADGSIKVGSNGKPVEAKWVIGNDGPESLRWECSDKSIRPFKNNNGDIFPEAELVKAHKDWISKPLCIDHRSNSVDAIRGVILDTYYDFKAKQVIALCALDKVSYPDLARKVSTGYSTSVSMGTIVEKAICGVDTCNKVARSERDFCDHMKTKHADGEINCQLKPIELSIVVNPADPSAKIRTIFASMQKLQNHEYSSDMKEKERQLKNDLSEVQKKLGELDGISVEEQEILESPPQDLSDNQLRMTAEWKSLFEELKILKTSMEKTLEDINKKQEDNMTDRDNSMDKKSYYLGGGGVNEPGDRGKRKYETDPLADKLRDEDRQMLQTDEYGGVKRDNEIRSKGRPSEMAERRKQALDNAKKNLTKEGYWMVDKDGNPVRPTKYDVDKLAEELREDGDRQMAQIDEYGGALDDLARETSRPGYAKDELRKNKLVSKASDNVGLKARFFRKASANGSDDIANSGWQIYQKDEKGEKLLFTASVNEIAGGQVEQLSDMIATKEFGTKMLEKVREVGVSKAASLYKKAQALPSAPPADPAAAPPVDPAAAAMPVDAAPPPAEADATEDTGGKGDKKEVAADLAEKVRDNASDLLEVVRDITGNQSEVGDLEDGIKDLPPATASVLMPAVRMRKKLESMLVSAAKKSLAELREHHAELKLIADMADGEAVKNASIRSMIDSAFTEAETALSDSTGVLRAYATYASGVENLQARVKQAEEDDVTEGDLDDMSADDSSSDDMDANDDFGDPAFEDEMDPMGDTLDLHNGHEDGLLDEELNYNPHAHEAPNTGREPDLFGPDTVHEPDLFGPEGDEMDADDMTNKIEVTLAPGQAAPAPGQAVPPNAVVAPKAASMDLTTRAGRMAYRTKLAEQLGEIEDATKIKYNPVLNDAHKDLDQDIDHDLANKSPDGLARMMTKEEQHKCTLDVATSPVRVQKEAARLNKMISEGSVSENDLDQLVSEGLDAEVVKYWKDYYGTDNAEFAKLLTTAAEKEKTAEDLQNYKHKLARSYDLANEMARSGLISSDNKTISRQVDESMQWNDEAFDSFKRVVAKQSAKQVKTAGTFPQVGIRGGDDMIVTASDDLQSELDRCFADSGRKSGRF